MMKRTAIFAALVILVVGAFTFLSGCDMEIDSPYLEAIQERIAEDVEKAEVPSYTVTFESNGGSAVESQTVIAGGKVTKPTDPTRADAQFAGWYAEDTLTALWVFSTDTVTSDITLFAKWALVPVYTVTFESNGGGEVDTQLVMEGGFVVEPADPYRTGHTFSGWYEDVSATSWNFYTDTVGASIVLYAKWTLNIYTVTYNAGTGSVSGTVPLDDTEYDYTNYMVTVIDNTGNLTG